MSAAGPGSLSFAAFPFFRFGPASPVASASPESTNSSSPDGEAFFAAGRSQARLNEMSRPSFVKVSLVTRTRPARTSPPSTSSKARRSRPVPTHAV